MRKSTFHMNHTRVMAGIILALIALLLPFGAVARAGEGGDGIGYYVRALLPDNQIDPTLTYFDLRMQPGAQQTLEVEVINETDAPMIVDIRAVSASTNRNGIIDYKTPGVRDKTLLHPFSEIANPEAPSVSIAPHSAATVRVHMLMPDALYDGVVLGGLHFTRRPQETAAGEGVLLQNVYSYIIGVKLSETDVPVLPEFELDSVAAQAVDYQPAIVHYLRNKTAAIAKGIAAGAVVRNASNEVVASAYYKELDMAPNSVLELAVTPTAPDGGSGQLEPGEYISEVTITQDGQDHVYTQAFTIGSVEAQSANNALPAVAPAAPNTLVILLAAACCALLLLLLFLLLLLRKKRATA